VSEGNVELARRALELFNGGDRDALAAVTAPNAEIVPMRAALEGTVFSGENSFAEFWEAMDETWEYTQIDAEEILDCGEQVLVVGRLRGRTKSTAVEVDSPMGWVLAFDGDKVASLRTYTDIAEAREAAGVGS
jgi:ketosteroid isomerase-like protein